MRSLGACYQQFSIYLFHYMSKFQFVAVSFIISVIDKVQFFFVEKKDGKYVISYEKRSRVRLANLRCFKSGDVRGCFDLRE